MARCGERPRCHTTAARALACHPKTMGKVRSRSLRGERGGEAQVNIVDKEGSGVEAKAGEVTVQFGHGRPTWTLRLLMHTMADRT